MPMPLRRASSSGPMRATGGRGRATIGPPLQENRLSKGETMSDIINTTARTRTFSWENPRQSARILRKMSGLQTLDASLRGEFPDPPIAHLLETTLIEAEYGWAVFTFTPAEFHCNLQGCVDTGMVATVVDSALGCAIQSMLPAGDYGVTQGLQLKFLRPLPLEAGPIRVEAEVIMVGVTTATAQARVVDEDAKQYAYATTTFLIYRRQLTID